MQVGNKNKEPNVVFNASHPFLFFVEDQRSGSILFIGKVADPRKRDVLDVPNRFAEIPSVLPIGKFFFYARKHVVTVRFVQVMDS